MISLLGRLLHGRLANEIQEIPGSYKGISNKMALGLHTHDMHLAATYHASPPQHKTRYKHHHRHHP